MTKGLGETPVFRVVDKDLPTPSQGPCCQGLLSNVSICVSSLDWHTATPQPGPFLLSLRPEGVEHEAGGVCGTELCRGRDQLEVRQRGGPLSAACPPP